MKAYSLIVLFFMGSITANACENHIFGEISPGIKILGDGYNNWNGDRPISFRGGYHWNVKKYFYVRVFADHTSNLDRSDKFEGQLNWVGATIGVKIH